MKRVITMIVLAVCLGLAVAPATQSQETGRSRGFGFVEMPNQSESEWIVLICNSEPKLISPHELGNVAVAFASISGTDPRFVGFRPVDLPFLMPIEDVFEVPCFWRDVVGLVP